MTYRFVYTQRAIRDIKRLEQKTKDRLVDTLFRYKENPLKYAEKLIDPVLGTYRFKIGDYRIIFDVDKDTIVILRVGHRREIYKRK